MYACWYGNTDIVSLLLAHGAVIDHCKKVKDLAHVPTHTLTDCSMWSYQNNGMTALMCASLYGKTEIVKVLLQHGASLDLTDVRNRVFSHTRAL